MSRLRKVYGRMRFRQGMMPSVDKQRRVCLATEGPVYRVLWWTEARSTGRADLL